MTLRKTRHVWKNHREVEFADITDNTAIDNNSVQCWIKSLLLFEEDRKCFQSGDWLSNAHIFAAFKLLKKAVSTSKWPLVNLVAGKQA